MKKFKHWLIKKLGGCLKSDKTIVLTKTTTNTETVNAEFEVNGYRPFATTEIEKFLSHQIGQEIYLRGLCEVLYSYDEITDKTRYKCVVCVLDQERSEGK